MSFFSKNAFPPDKTLNKYFVNTIKQDPCCIEKLVANDVEVGMVCVTSVSGEPTFSIGAREQSSSPFTSADILQTTWAFVQTNDLTRPITIQETVGDEFTGPRVHGFVQAVSFLGADRPLLVSYGPAFNRLQWLDDLGFSWAVAGGGSTLTVTINASSIGLENIASGLTVWQADDPIASGLTRTQVVRETNSFDPVDTSTLDPTVPWGVSVTFPNPDDLDLANPATIDNCGGVGEDFVVIIDPQSNPIG